MSTTGSSVSSHSFASVGPSFWAARRASGLGKRDVTGVRTIPHERRVDLNSRSGGYATILPDLADSQRSLAGVWRLTAPGANGVIEDVEALVVGAVAESFRRHPLVVAAFTHDEAVEHLLGEVWVLFTKYDPSKRQGSGSFSGYMYDRLRFRLLDHARKVGGRKGEKLATGEIEEFRLLDLCDQPSVEDEPWEHAVPIGISQQARVALAEIGDLLMEGFTYREIADKLKPPRSEDYVASKVKLLREELADLLLEVAA